MKKHTKKQITEKDRKIYEALFDLNNSPQNNYQQQGFGPSQIGVKVGRDKYDAASYCTLSLKKLIEFGLVEKLPNGRYVPITKTPK
ncbi:hypothetical protein [Bacillus sp. ISL-45]|uniref:hypothetical protein n=1 Tax=Bacillus sp. ISL-45 TaxID=2819128 RepID=UPI001BEBC2B8|nr:hypothetical protein [Bacillus sp. ISL-45]MBT2663872.1 hypothetical protein [Bacillus sp. ISL-45]